MSSAHAKALSVGRSGDVVEICGLGSGHTIRVWETKGGETRDLDAPHGTERYEDGWRWRATKEAGSEHSGPRVRELAMGPSERLLGNNICASWSGMGRGAKDCREEEKDCPCCSFRILSPRSVDRGSERLAAGRMHTPPGKWGPGHANPAAESSGPLPAAHTHTVNH